MSPLVGANPSRPCRICGKPLNKSLITEDRSQKSCPCCSVHFGQHVFHPYPAEFGETDARASSTELDGAQSWCQACRDKQPAHDGPRCFTNQLTFPFDD